MTVMLFMNVRRVDKDESANFISSRDFSVPLTTSWPQLLESWKLFLQVNFKVWSKPFQSYIKALVTRDILTHISRYYNDLIIISYKFLYVINHEKYFINDLCCCSNTVHFVTGRTNETIHEESEPEEFWNSIGGQGAYSQCSGRFDKPILEPRLFHCKMIGDTGKMVASEVHNFEKDVSFTNFSKYLLS